MIGDICFSGAGSNDTWYVSLAINNSNNLYVGYQDGSGGNWSKSSVMTFNGSSWEYVGSSGFSAGASYHQSLAIDDSNNLFITYQDGGNNFKASTMKFSGTLLGIEDMMLTDLKIYSYNSQIISNRTVDLTVFNLLGQKVENKNLDSGIYIVKAKDERGRIKTIKLAHKK